MLVGCVVLVAACGETAPDQTDSATPDSSTQQDVGSMDVVIDSSNDANDAAETSTGSDASGDADGGADAPVDAAADASVDAGACGAYESNGPYGCNKLLPPSSKIPLTCVSEPAATGGPIADGYYELTGYAFDTQTFDASCPSGVTHSGIVMFCSGTMLWFDIDQNSSSFDSTGTYATNGNTITISPLSGCSGNKDTYEYTATATTFEIRGGSPITQVLTYTMK